MLPITFSGKEWLAVFAVAVGAFLAIGFLWSWKAAAFVAGVVILAPVALMFLAVAFWLASGGR
jgi:multisubunit Na+/H+ antiporter MnhG subunit